MMIPPSKFVKLYGDIRSAAPPLPRYVACITYTQNPARLAKGGTASIPPVSQSVHPCGRKISETSAAPYLMDRISLSAICMPHSFPVTVVHPVAPCVLKLPSAHGVQLGAPDAAL